MPKSQNHNSGDLKSQQAQGTKAHPKKPPTQANPTKNSLRKQFAQVISEEKRETTCTNNSKKSVGANCFIGMGVFLGWVSFPEESRDLKSWDAWDAEK